MGAASQQQGSEEEDAITVHQRDRHGLPLNAEVKSEELVSHFITPTDAIFHRNHDDIVQVPQDVAAVEEDWQLTITVEEDVLAATNGAVTWPQHLHARPKTLPSQSTVSKPLSPPHTMVSYGQLLRDKQVHRTHATATLECAGNRREALAEQGGKAEGIQWGAGAISTAHWYGPSIRDLLIAHGVPDPYAHHEDAVKGDLIPSQDALDRDCAAWARPLHLHMLSAQPTSESDQPQGEYFGASIRLATAMHPQQQCIIATHHNGSVLTQSHGFPLRVVVPGHVGARWVKWLRGLHVSTQYEQSPPMRLDYKILTPPRDASKGEQKEWKEKLMGPDKDVAFRKDELADKKAMQTLGVGSAIETPADGDSFADRGDKEGAVVTARGYATGQDGSPVTQVELVLLVQESPDESMPSLRQRAARLPSTSWLSADVETEQQQQQQQQQDEAERMTAQSQPPSFAWSLWHCQVPLSSASETAPPSAQGADTPTSYALVARATTAAGIVQERESPWNIRGFATRSWPVVRGLKKPA